MAARFDLAHIRHELRSPINLILGYCEMLLEEEHLPAAMVADVGRIHAGGKQLLQLISRYLTDETFGVESNFQQIQHELRTPVNHIIGYSELLLEQVSERSWTTVSTDLEKIRTAARTWLKVMESHLLPRAVGAPAPKPRPKHKSQPVSRNTSGNSSAAAVREERLGALLLVDDEESSRELLARRLHRAGFDVTTAAGGLEALQILKKNQSTSFCWIWSCRGSMDWKF